MSDTNKKSNAKKKRKGIFRKWHRRMGFVASLFLLNLAVTGILLNHYEALGFHQRYIKSDWLLSLYQVELPKTIDCLVAADNTICQIDEFVYLDEQFWQQISGQLVASGNSAEGLVLVTSQTLYLLTPSLQLIESFTLSEHVDGLVYEAVISYSDVKLATESNHYSLDLDTLNWETKKELERINHSRQEPVTPSAEASLKIRQDYRTRQITQLQFIQDLHSGSLFRLPGKLVNDITAVLVILLALSGFITWQQRKNR